VSALIAVDSSARRSAVVAGGLKITGAILTTVGFGLGAATTGFGGALAAFGGADLATAVAGGGFAGDGMGDAAGLVLPAVEWLAVARAGCEAGRAVGCGDCVGGGVGRSVTKD
jgi:hypothetical protein